MLPLVFSLYTPIQVVAITQQWASAACTSIPQEYIIPVLVVFSLHKNTTGALNVALGYQSSFSNTTGYSNVAIGASALYSNTTGSGTIAIGDSALLKKQ